MFVRLMVLVIGFGPALGCATTPPTDTAPPAPWGTLLHQAGESGGGGAASVPLARNTSPELVDALLVGRVQIGGRQVQAQPVAHWPGDDGVRRVLMRWLADSAGPTGNDLTYLDQAASDAGWSFDYRLVESSNETRPWQVALRNLPLDETEYEMHQLDLANGDKKLGIRLGLRHNNRIYWWQFVRADWVHRGPVCDVLRAGGPIYNEQSTLQADLYLVLYANGTIEVTPHFINHMREGEGMDLNGVPVVALDLPGTPQVDHVLDGATARFDLGTSRLNLDYTVHMADAERPGSLRTEDGIVVLQPWLDQQIFGGMLVYDEGIPEHRILRKGGTTAEVKLKANLGEADRYYVTTIGDRLIPRGVARSFRFVLSVGEGATDIARYQAPGWWQAQAQAVPTRGNLPVSWWAVPHAVKTGGALLQQQGNTGPYEYGRSVRDGDGSAGSAMLALGHSIDEPRFSGAALPACYWRADIPINHETFAISETPYFGWQWIVQPYSRYMSAVAGYLETGDPYLFETAELAADGYYRFFLTNRPHRSVGRDSLPVYGMLALYECTGKQMYLDRAHRVLSEGWRSYAQTKHYWPGHQSGAGTNGVGMRPGYDYMPSVLSRLTAELLHVGGDAIPEAEQAKGWDFVRFMTQILEEKGPGPGEAWFPYCGALLYSSLPALAEQFPKDAAHYAGLLNKYNDLFNMPEGHSGDKAYSFVSGAIRFDSWVWGATWQNDTLHLRPQWDVLWHHKAPREATIHTPKGPVHLWRSDVDITQMGGADVKIVVEK
jgi:hypothetical protein